MKEKDLLTATKELQVRFHDLDPMQVVWHGNYIKYFEDGREEFGQRFGISYMDMRREKIMTPVVSIHCDYKSFIRYGDTLIVITSYVEDPAAKIVLRYVIKRKADNKIVAEGRSVQVFTDFEGNLSLIDPPYIKAWKKKWGISK